jgi:hypothetical protein
MRRSPKTGGFLPAQFHLAHDVCFFNHDVLVQLLQSGEECGSFETRIRFRDDADRRSFEEAGDVLSWLAATRRVTEQAEVLRSTVFPALLSDLLHFLFEALDCSRKAKLAVSFALLRKPLQENLFLMEVIASDVADFSAKLAENPLGLRAQKVGGPDVHAARLSTLLDGMGESDRFDASYLAQLRYDKKTEDSFDGICNKAVHLFTEHPAIRTEPLDINFVFSDWDDKVSQWAYLYSRLPYLLFYSRRLVEYVLATFEKTEPEYLDDMERRAAAGALLWVDTLQEPYRHPSLDRFSEGTRSRLDEMCRSRGFRVANRRDLGRMRKSGALPGERAAAVRERHLGFVVGARLSRAFRHFRK